MCTICGALEYRSHVIEEFITYDQSQKRIFIRFIRIMNVLIVDINIHCLKKDIVSGNLKDMTKILNI